jgi:hypothetical protein
MLSYRHLVIATRVLRGCLECLLDRRFERHRVVVRGIPRAIEPRHVPALRRLDDGQPGLRVAAQFAAIAAPEVCPFRRIMPKPAAQGLAGGGLFEPESHVPRLLKPRRAR